MRLSILTLICSLSVLVFATYKVEDKDDIKDLLSGFAFGIDAKKYDQLDKIFTPDLTFDVGDGQGSRKGLPALEKALRQVIPANVSSTSHVTTNLIKLLPPYDKEGRSDRAEAVSYTFFVFFSAGNVTKEFLFTSRYVDKEIIRTKEDGFGGWRIKNRKTELVVGFSFHIPENA